MVLILNLIESVPSVTTGQASTLLDLIIKGGIIMIPIVLLSILSASS